MNAQQLYVDEKEERDLPCIWMMAGVVNFKLCDYQYDCEHCPFDRAFHTSEPESQGNLSTGMQSLPEISPTQLPEIVDEQVNFYLTKLIAGSKLYLDRCYSHSHFWMYPESAQSVVVGFDQNIFKLLEPVARIVPPEPGSELSRDQLCALVIHGDRSIPLHSPLTGQVIEVNNQYLDEIHDQEHASDPWFFKIRPVKKANVTGDLCQGEAMLNWYVGKIRAIKTHLWNRLSHSADANIGVTMADGGAPEMNLEKVLGTDTYWECIKQILEIP